MKIKEVRFAFLFFVTKQIAHVVPKRVFNDKQEEIDTIRKLIKNNKSTKKELL